MALAVVANVAAVAQLIEQATGLVSRIIRAVATARQNKRECEHLALRLSIIGDVLPHLPRVPVVERPLKELRTALGKAHELVLACQDRSAANRFFGARRHADSFREVNARIYFLLSLFPMVNYAAITSHLARITPAHTGVQTTITVPSPSSLQTQPVVPDYPCMFTWAEIVTATNNFADKLGRGCSWTVYKGRLHDGPEVAVKVLDKHRPHDTFVPELVITFRLRHDHIVRLVGWCEEEDDRMFVYEHISNGTLRDQLQRVRGRSSSSAVTAAPWRRPGGQRQMEALEIVADTARRCVSRMDRPAMSKVVANLEEALVVIRSHEPMSMARLSLIRRRTSES